MSNKQLEHLRLVPDFVPNDEELSLFLDNYDDLHVEWTSEVPNLAVQADKAVVETVVKTKDWVAENAQTVTNVAAVAATTAALSVSGMAMTAPKTQAVKHKEVTATVPAGSNLTQEAIEYSTTVPDILKANPQITNANDVKAGETIVIPIKSTAPVAPAATTSTSAAEVATSTTIPANTTTTTLTPSKNIYLVGDSLLVGMAQNGLSTNLAKQGWTVSKIEATVGATVSSSIPAVEADASEIKDSSTAVVELDLNDCDITQESANCDPEPEVIAQNQEMVSTLRTINPNITIDWVNTYATNSSANQSVNEAISADAAPDKYSVIDWDGYAAAHTSQFSFDRAQGIHQTTYAGYANEASVIASGIGAAPAPVAPAAQPEVAPAATTTTTEAPAPTTTTTVAAPEVAPAPPAPEPLDEVINTELEVWGLSPQGSAAVIGNMDAESGLQPERLENTPNGVATAYGNIPLSLVQNQYYGWGLVQWTPIESKIGAYAAARHEDPNAQATQVMFLEDELEGLPTLLGDLKNPAVSPQEGAALFEADYERPKVLTDAPTREAFAVSEFNKLNPPAPAPPPAPTPAPVPVATTTTTTVAPAPTTTTQPSAPSTPKHAVSTTTLLPASKSVPKHAAPAIQK